MEKKTFTKIVRKCQATGAALATVSTGLLVPTAFADNAQNNIDNAATNIIGAVAGVVMTVFRYIGVVLLVWSIGQLILAFKNEDADSKSRAVMIMIVSIALISSQWFIDKVLNVTNTGIKVNTGS